MKTRVATWTIAVLVLSIAAFAQGPRRDGLWEVTMNMQMELPPGAPAGMTIPGITTQQCITPEDARDPSKALPPQGRGGARGGRGDCTVSDYKIEGNKVSWNMRCTGAEPVSGSGEFTYGADTYTGLMKMDVGGRSMNMKYTGKRLGDCKK